MFQIKNSKKNGKRFYFSRSDGFEPSKSKYRNLNYYPFLKFAVCFPNAERKGFEPLGRYERPTVFKTAAIDHSATSPLFQS